MSNDLTVGSVLPDNIKSGFPDSVLNTSLEEAIGIAEFDKPSSSGLSADDITSLKQIYQMYISNGGKGDTDSAYWNKSKTDNEAYWNKS